MSMKGNTKYKVSNDGSLRFQPTVVDGGSTNALHSVQKEERKLLLEDRSIAQFAKEREQLTMRLKLPPDVLSTRESVAWLETSMQKRLHSLRNDPELGRHDCVLKSQQVFNDVAQELFRQVSIECVDRGRLLAKLWIRYSDLINEFGTMFVEERKRHREEEEKHHNELIKARVDYAAVVERFEGYIEESHERELAILEEQRVKEEKLCSEINALKEDLCHAQAALRIVEAPVATEVTGRRGGDDASLNALRLELQTLRLHLLDASAELQQYRSQKDRFVTRGMNTDAVATTSRGESPFFLEDEEMELTENSTITPRLERVRKALQ